MTLDQAIAAYHTAEEREEKCNETWEDARRREREAAKLTGVAGEDRDRAWREVLRLIRERRAK